VEKNGGCSRGEGEKKRERKIERKRERQCLGNGGDLKERGEMV